MVFETGVVGHSAQLPIRGTHWARLSEPTSRVESSAMKHKKNVKGEDLLFKRDKQIVSI